MHQFKIGDRVRWASNPQERGTIVEVREDAAMVSWDDGDMTLYDTLAGLASITLVSAPDANL